MAILRERFGGGGPVHCSFCGQGKDEYKAIVAGPSVFICDKCVLSCVKIMRESKVEGFAEGTPQ